MVEGLVRRMSAELAHSDRWRAGVGDRRAAKLERLYEGILDRFEADGVRCSPLLRRTLERSRAPKANRPRPVAFLAGDETPVGVRR